MQAKCNLKWNANVAMQCETSRSKIHGFRSHATWFGHASLIYNMCSMCKAWLSPTIGPIRRIQEELDLHEPNGLHGLQMLFSWVKEDTKIWWVCPGPIV